MGSLEGRGFLLPTGRQLDAYSWNVRKSESSQGGHHAQLDLRVGKNTITLHTHNDGLDTGFILFSAKLRKVLNTVTEFLEIAPFYDFKQKGKAVSRHWLNPEDSIDAMFTGSIVTVYDEHECMLELSSCDRSTRFFITPTKRNNLRISNQKEVGRLLGVKRAILEVLDGIERLLTPKESLAA